MAIPIQRRGRQSGTWAPTFGDFTNITTVVLLGGFATWNRVGSQITCTVRCNVLQAAPGVAAFSISVPSDVTKTFSGTNEVAGVGTLSSIGVGHVSSIDATEKVNIDCDNGGALTESTFIFSYLI